MSQQSKWYLNRGIDDDIVISSKMTIQRNLLDYHFPPKMTDQEAMQVIEEISNAFFKDNEYMARRYRFIRLDRLEDKGKLFWVQRHVLNQEALSPQWPEALILSEDESVSLWINSENHLQIQVIHRGFRIGRNYDLAKDLDTFMASRLKFAYSKKYGYLTAATSDMGTGMHVTFYMHLPFMESMGILPQMEEKLQAQGYVIRMVKDINPGAAGHIFEVTNKQTLGLSETDILDRASLVEEMLVKRERELKAVTLAGHRIDYEDNIYKAYGILRYARKLSIEDATEYLSFVDQGISDKSLKLKDSFDVLPILMDIQSESLQKIVGAQMDPDTLAQFRAGYIQERLPDIDMEV